MARLPRCLSVNQTNDADVRIDLSTATVQKNIDLANRVRDLERELQVWKIAQNASQDEVERGKKESQQEKLILEQRISTLESEKASIALMWLILSRLIVAG